MHIHFNRLISSAASCINLFLTGSRRHQQPKPAKWIWEFVLLSLSSQQAIFQPAWNKHQPLHLFAARPCSVQVCHFVSAGTTSLLRHTSCMIYSAPDVLVVAGWRHSWEAALFSQSWNILHLLNAVPLYSSLLQQAVVLVKSQKRTAQDREMSSHIRLGESFFPKPFGSGWQCQAVSWATTNSCHYNQEPSLFLSCLPSFCKPDGGNYRKLGVSSHFSWGTKSCCC